MNTHIYIKTHVRHTCLHACTFSHIYTFTRDHLQVPFFPDIVRSLCIHTCVCIYVCMHMNAYLYASICQLHIHLGAFTGASSQAAHLPRHRIARLLSFACGGGWAGVEWAAVYDVWGHNSQVCGIRKFDVVQGDRHCEIYMMQCNCVQKWTYAWCSAIVCISLWSLTLSDSLYYSAPMLSYRHISPAPLFRLTSSFRSPCSFHPHSYGALLVTWISGETQHDSCKNVIRPFHMCDVAQLSRTMTRCWWLQITRATCLSQS